jgi:hypothetical protein
VRKQHANEQQSFVSFAKSSLACLRTRNDRGGKEPTAEKSGGGGDACRKSCAHALNELRARCIIGDVGLRISSGRRILQCRQSRQAQTATEAAGSEGTARSRPKGFLMPG